MVTEPYCCPLLINVQPYACTFVPSNFVFKIQGEWNKKGASFVLKFYQFERGENKKGWNMRKYCSFYPKFIRDSTQPIPFAKKYLPQKKFEVSPRLLFHVSLAFSPKCWSDSLLPQIIRTFENILLKKVWKN